MCGLSRNEALAERKLYSLMANGIAGLSASNPPRDLPAKTLGQRRLA